MLQTLPRESVLLLKGFNSQERLGNVAVTLLRFLIDHFKPRKVSINDRGSESLIFILPSEMQQARITG